MPDLQDEEKKYIEHWSHNRNQIIISKSIFAKRLLSSIHVMTLQIKDWLQIYMQTYVLNHYTSLAHIRKPGGFDFCQKIT